MQQAHAAPLGRATHISPEACYKEGQALACGLLSQSLPQCQDPTAPWAEMHGMQPRLFHARASGRRHTSVDS